MRKYTRPFFVLLLVVLMAVGMMPFIDTIQLRKDLVELREARRLIVDAYTGKR